MDFEKLTQLIIKNRSYRRFHQNYFISIENLRNLIDLARLSPSAANLQPLRYYISNDPSVNEKIFQCLKFAAYLKDWGGPKEGEKPSAYIIVFSDTEISKSPEIDAGIASQSILLGAVSMGLGGCIIANINREKIYEILRVDKKYKILFVIALGKPSENILLEEVSDSGDIKYYRDEYDNHHVPKRKLDDIIIGIN